MTAEQRAINGLKATDADKEIVARYLEHGHAQIIYFDANPIESSVDCQWLADLMNLATGKRTFTAENVITYQQDRYFFFGDGYVGGVVVIL